jgi:hypothetical protein
MPCRSPYSPAVASTTPRICSSRFAHTLNDGRKIDRSKYYPSGSMQVPMSPAQIKAKFDICAAQAIDNSVAEKIYVMLSTIGERPRSPSSGRYCGGG